MIHEDRRIGAIHRRSNEKKFFCYFTGFIEGILASGRIEQSEIEPLIVTCREFVANVGDADAADFLQDFEVDLMQEDLLADCVRYRLEEIEPDCPKSSVNRFLGFCAGIACDSLITYREARKLVEFSAQFSELSASPGIRELLNTARDALEDGVVDPDEAREISISISRLVGDCYTDTGITAISSAVVFEEDSLCALESGMDGCKFVLTGTFMMSPRKSFEARLEELGISIGNSVSRKTDVLLIGGRPSRDWLETNRGTKLIKAVDLRANGSRPYFISEAQMLQYLEQ